jgi:hypothetical protein
MLIKLHYLFDFLHEDEISHYLYLPEHEHVTRMANMYNQDCPHSVVSQYEVLLAHAWIGCDC